MTIEYPWNNEENPNLGNIPKPIAEVGIKNSSGEWIRYILKIDSGASVTILSFSDCSDLGYRYEDGEETYLGPLTGPQVKGRIHKLDLKLGGEILENVPIVFAERKLNDLLLGRKEIFTVFDIHLKGNLCKTVLERV